jgi:hypothetical protein
MSIPPPADVTCPHCGARNPPGSNFCNRCGATLTEPLADSVAAGLDLTAQDPAAPLYGMDLPDEEAMPFASGPAQEIERAEGAVEGVDEDAIEATLGARPPAAEPDAHDRVPGEIVPGALAPGEGGELVLFPDEQVLGGGLGYLESVAIAGETLPMLERAAPVPGGHAGPAALADAEHWRTLRSLLRDEPVLATALASTASQPFSYRRLWIVLLLLAAALLPFGMDADRPYGTPAAWPGVERAYNLVEQVEVDDEVLVFWQVDPSTAGELNLVANPVISHLLQRSARSIVITLQPTGLATARRLYAEAVAGLDESALITVLEGWVGDGIFLAGGAAALPLVAQAPGRMLSFTPAAPPAPRLALLVAPQADDIQQWLEIVQPRSGLTAVAVTSAAAEPVLRPYLESRQLGGLVAGFDGAAAYQALREQTPRPAGLSAAARHRLTLVTNAQNWGALALVLILLAGNLVRLFWRERRA